LYAVCHTFLLLSRKPNPATDVQRNANFHEAIVPGSAKSRCASSRTRRGNYWVKFIMKHSGRSSTTKAKSRSASGAQRAILNPSRPRKEFLDGTGNNFRPTELSFSNNCVSLQISGPDVADLSFCDLPGNHSISPFYVLRSLTDQWRSARGSGLIASVSSSGGHANDIILVEGLVTSYIKKPSCIILLTVTCESKSSLPLYHCTSVS
jgi:hypothetical protein